MPPVSKNQQGFTFIEVLLAALITSFLGGVIYSTLSQGLKVWHRAMRPNLEFDIDLVYEKLNTDLRNAQRFGSGHFNGERESIEFFTLLSSQISSKKNQFHADLPARVRYFYDSHKKNINRTTQNYYQLLNATEDKPVTRVIQSGIADCRFEFYDPGSRKRSPEWKRKWESQCLPPAIRVRIDYHENHRVKSLSKIIRIPVDDCLAPVGGETAAGTGEGRV